MHYEYLLFKGIQGGYFYTTHFYEAKRTSIIFIIFENGSHLGLLQFIFTEIEKNCYFRSGLWANECPWQQRQGISRTK